MASFYNILVFASLVLILLWAVGTLFGGVVKIVARFQIERERKVFEEFQSQVPEIYRVPTHGDPTAPGDTEGLSGIVENWRKGMGS